MPGTRAGGLKAAATNKEKYGSEFYKAIGSRGGKNGHTGGFAANRELAREAGRKGGRVGGKIGKRGYKLHKAEDGSIVYTRMSDHSITPAA